MRRLFCAAVVLSSSFAWGATYKLDPTHTEVGFSVKHLMITTVKGRFNKFEGSFDFDETKNELTNANVKIDAKSVDTNDKKRDDHLRNEDFFFVKKHPDLTFKQEGPVTLTDKKAKVAGTLTMRGVSKPVTLDLEYTGSATDPWGNEKVGFVATGMINRKDFGVSWNKALDKGGVTVSDEVNIRIEGEAVKEKAAAAAPAKKK